MSRASGVHETLPSQQNEGIGQGVPSTLGSNALKHLNKISKGLAHEITDLNNAEAVAKEQLHKELNPSFWTKAAIAVGAGSAALGIARAGRYRQEAELSRARADMMARIRDSIDEEAVGLIRGGSMRVYRNGAFGEWAI